MCQQWFSLFGLTLEVIGFVFVVSEWSHVFKHSALTRQNAVEADYELTTQSMEADNRRRLAEASMWRNTQRENRIDNRWRARVFYIGVLLVLLGFAGQAIGSLPYGISVIGFKSCS